MRAKQGTIIASITVHLFFFGMVLVCNQVYITQMKPSSAPIYINLEDFFQSSAEASPSPQQSFNLVQPKSEDPNKPMPLDIRKVFSGEQNLIQQYKPPTPPTTQPKVVLAEHTKKVYSIQTKLKQQTPQIRRTVNRTSDTTAQQQGTPQPDGKNVQDRKSTGRESRQDPSHDEVVSATRSLESNTPSPTKSISEAYLGENYAYIRDLIAKNIVFPPIARKLGWRGRLIVSFVLDREGSASAIQIVESSGRELLDRNVTTAIKRTAPFPPPKREITLVVPVTYDLK